MADLEGEILLDRYFLRKIAGKGGMSEVYESWDQERGTIMAIKVLRRDLVKDTRAFQLFAQEAELLRKLEHPNIVRLYEFDRDGDHAFIVLDWINGISLNKAVNGKKTPFSLEEVSIILEPVASALNYAHQRNVFHCDVKPGNIMLRDVKPPRYYIREKKDILLTDFGVARLAHEKRGGGTVQYMAPEQIKSQEVDARTDVYALGIVLYEMLSGGNLPYRGTGPESKGTTSKERIAWEHLNMRLPPLHTFNPLLPVEVEQVIQTALNKKPSRRYSTVLDLHHEFESARSGGKQIPKDRIFESQTDNKTIWQNKAKVTKSEESLFDKSSMTMTYQKGKIQDPHLIGREGVFNGKRLPLNYPQVTLGRSKQNLIQLNDRSVSRRHATIMISKRGSVLKDNGSKYGTLINGKKIQEPILLHHGDIIQFGAFLIFEYREK